jgi:hypothetical protein
MSLLSRIRNRGIAAGFAVLLAMLWAPLANATHKIDHRYTVWGEIQYEEGEPAADNKLHLMVKNGAPMGEVNTDAKGRYRILLHVHNEDVYKVFDMRANNVTRKVRLLFSPNDRQTERGQRVDLVVKRAGEFETSGVLTQ